MLDKLNKKNLFMIMKARKITYGNYHFEDFDICYVDIERSILSNQLFLKSSKLKGVSVMILKSEYKYIKKIK